MSRRRQVTVIDGLRFATSIAGVPIVFPLGLGHLLVAGRTGAGKSTVLRALLFAAAHQSAGMTVGTALRGAELPPWHGRLEPPAPARPGAVRTRAVVRQIIDVRLDKLTAGVDVDWNTELGPWLLL